MALFKGKKGYAQLQRSCCGTRETADSSRKLLNESEN
jgi:hypothetical protein